MSCVAKSASDMSDRLAASMLPTTDATRIQNMAERAAALANSELAQRVEFMRSST